MFDFILQLEQAKTKNGIVRSFVEGIGKIIPFESFAAIFLKTQRLVGGSSGIESLPLEYVERFRTISPPYCKSESLRYPSEGFFRIRRIDYGRYRDSEFYAEFSRPCRVEYALVYPLPEGRYVPAISRSASEPDFSEREERILGILAPHFNYIATTIERFEKSDPLFTVARAIAKRFPTLSFREAEIADLLCRGLDIPDIAERLFLSSWIVETHLFDLCEKLQAKSRARAVAFLNEALDEERATLPERWAGGPSRVNLASSPTLNLIEEHFIGEYSLSLREKEVAALLLDRYDYDTIASILGISVNTLKVHVKSVYRKCDVSARKELLELVSRLKTAYRLA